MIRTQHYSGWTGLPASCWPWLFPVGPAKEHLKAAGRIGGAGILPASKACKMHALRGSTSPRYKELPYPSRLGWDAAGPAVLSIVSRLTSGGQKKRMRGALRRSQPTPRLT